MANRMVLHEKGKSGSRIISNFIKSSSFLISGKTVMPSVRLLELSSLVSGNIVDVN